MVKHEKRKMITGLFSVIVMMLLMSVTGFSQEKPGPTNTGPTGTLTPASGGNITVAGTVIENKLISSTLYIKANNVTIRNCLIDCNYGSYYYGIQCTYGYTGTVIEDCEIREVNSAGIYGENFTARRCNIHETHGDAIKVINSNTLIEYNWMHHLGNAELAHADGIQWDRTQGSNHVIRYNNFDMPYEGFMPPDWPYHANSALIVSKPTGPVTGIAEHNWFGGGTNILNVGSSGFEVNYNKFGREYSSDIVYDGIETLLHHKCNTWEDTGEAIDACDENPSVIQPVINPSGGLYSSAVNVSITCATSGADIRYTLDGSAPTESSTLYTGSFTLSSSATVKARGYKTDMPTSTTASVSYVITSGTNISQGKPVTVSADDGNVGANITDGDISNTRWSASGYPQWAEIDLGSNYDLSTILVYTYQDRAYQYIVEASTDGSSYSTIVNRSTNADGSQPIADDVSATARYVKITVSGASGYTGTWVSINEVQVLGTGGGATVPVTGVSVSPTTLSLEAGQSADLTETVAPSNATNKSVTWSSNNTSVATVNSSGLVTAVAAGNATITVITNDGGYTANCAVTVTQVQPPLGAYYCDPVNGSMSNNGSESSPWSTLAAVFAAGKTFAAGDVIYLMDGNHGFPYVNQSNTGDVTITKYAGADPIVNRIDFVGASHWILDNVKVYTSAAPPDAPVLVHPVYAQYNNTLIRVNSGSSYITLSNCNVYSIENSSSWTANDWNYNAWNGLYINSADHHITVDACYFKNVKFGIHMNEDSQHNIVRNTTIENICADGLRPGDYALIENNVLKNFYVTSGNHYDMIQGFRLTDVVIRGNVLISATSNYPLAGECQGIGFFDGVFTNMIIENNVIISHTWHGISIYGAQNCKVVNNTVVKNPIGSYTGTPWIGIYNHTNGSASGNVIRNNYTSDINSTIGSTVSNNIVSQSYTTYFADYNGLDLHLKAGSPAIDAGTATDAPSVDIEGNARPQGAGYDVGAYEYGSVIIPVIGVSVLPLSLTLDIGQTADLTETVTPSNATDKSVSWSTSNSSVATVDANGLVTAIAEGNATITVTTTDGGFTAACAVTVNAPAGSYNLALGKPVTVSAYQDDAYGTYPGSNLVDGDVSDDARWSASGYSQWAEIDLGEDCDLSSIELYTYLGRAYQYIVEAKADGGSYSTIVDRSSNTSGTQPITDAVSTTARYVKITVSGASGYAGTWVSLNELNIIGSAGTSTIPVSGVSVSPTSLDLTEGETAGLTETVTPVDATDKSVSWSSNNSSVATVDANGLVTAVAAGSATITATTTDGGFSANCAVTVNPAIILVTGISVSPTSLDLTEGETADLTETVTPVDATDKSVSWSSNNSSVATVSASGLVTAIAEGNATITVTTTDGGYTANCAVTVSAPAETWTQLTYDDFESGWGNFKDGGGDCNLYTGGTYAHQGSNAAQIQDNQGDYSTFYYLNAIDVQAYSQIKVEFWFYGLGMDNGHEFFVEYSDNGGSTWQIVETYVQGSGADFVNGQFYSAIDGGDFEGVIIDNGSYNFTSNAKIRFRCNGLQNDDQVYIDEVKVTALSSGTSSANVSLAERVSNMSIYPNPLTGSVLNIVVDGYDSDEINVTIYDLSGRLVYNQSYFDQTELNIPVHNLSTGIYVISVNGKQQKLVIE